MHFKRGDHARSSHSSGTGVPGSPRSVRVRIRERARVGPDGIRRVVFEVVVGTGKARTVAGTRQTETEARVLMDEAARDVASGVLAQTVAKPGRMKDMIRLFRESKDRNPRLSRSWREAIRYRCASLTAALGEIPVDLLNRAHVDGFVRARLRTVRPETAHDDVTMLSQVLGMAVSEGWWQGTPDDLCGGHRLKGQGTKRWLQARDIEVVAAQIANPDVLIVYRIALGTGARVGEILHARWCDWLQDDGVLLIRAHGGWGPKDGDDRIVPVDDDLAKHLSCHRQRLEAEASRRLTKSLPAVMPGPHTPIVPSRDGVRRSTHNLFAKRVGEAARKAGLPGLSVHELRHSFATHWLQNGGSIYDLSEILGHSSVDLTASQYAHLCKKHVRSEANRIRARVLAVAGGQADRGVTSPVPCDNVTVLAVA